MLRVANRVARELAVRIIAIPVFLVKPRATLGKVLGERYREGAGLTAGLGYLVLGISAFYSVGSYRAFVTGRLTSMVEGSATRWVLYGLFVHSFIWLWGGRKGLLRTIDAYAYVIGILQPVLAFLLFGLSYEFPKHYEFETIQRSFGPSGFVSVLVVGHGATSGFSDPGFAIYEITSSLLISAYLCPALSLAHGLRVWRGVAAILTATVLFLSLNVASFAIVGGPHPSLIAWRVAHWLSELLSLLSPLY